MLIAVTGIKRSGSTAQFNMLRLICEATGRDVTIQDEDWQEGLDITIVKKHKFDSELYKQADYIFTTDRDDNEVFQSLKKFNGVEDRTRLIPMRNTLKKWMGRSYHFEYNDIKDRPKQCIKWFANILLVDIDVDEVYGKFKQVKPPEEGYDPETFLFHNHISDNS